MSPVRSNRSTTRGLLLAALLAYGLVLAVTPLLHHDFECHQRTPGHCVACIATPAALGGGPAALEVSPTLTDVGGVEPTAAAAAEAPLAAESHGRAPPL
jgi:hypothetical protein